MGIGRYLLLCLVLIAGVRSRQYIESELASLPKHFHLDDYEECLDRTDGVFCLGQFLVYSDDENNPTYQLIQKYKVDPLLYNRTYLHRGYCLTTRCAGADANLTARFERCVDKWAQDRHGLRARLIDFKYCKEHGKPLGSAPDTQDLPHRMFLYVILALLALNVIGTVYDLNVEKKGKQDSLLSYWSVRHNWNLLVAPVDPKADPGLESMNGVKAIMTFGPIYLHANIFQSVLYQQHPRNIEKYIGGLPGAMIGGFTTVTQAHIMISNLLTSYMVLSMPHLTPKKLVSLVLKRLVRMLPVIMLTVAFSATWWTSAGDGPMWHIVEAESAICKRKFWLMAVFLQNLIDPKHICLAQTWIMAVDMQVHIPVLVLTYLLKKHRRWAMPVISALIVAMVALLTHLAFEKNLIPSYHYMAPESYRESYYNVDSFMYFFITPLNCMLSVLIAIGIAFYQKDLRERGVKLEGKKSLVYLFYGSFVSIFVWCYCCYYFRDFTDRSYISAMIPIERVVCGVLMGICLFLMMNVDCALISFLRWEKCGIISRMALSIAMAHWCINGIIAAHRYMPINFSVIDFLLDALGTLMMSYVVAVPLTILVDYPMKQTLDRAIKLLF